ncbi:hypothetical protein DMB42_45230 [Nonomuraea sp. WAC 01424]|nr:hypothetical protein DMB42_45230 [Nonomuraea sp. WAC 01424]
MHARAAIWSTRALDFQLRVVQSLVGEWESCRRVVHVPAASAVLFTFSVTLGACVALTGAENEVRPSVSVAAQARPASGA